MKNWLYLIILALAALRVPTEVALQCVAGHCYYHRSVSLSLFFLLAQAALHAPPEVALQYVAGHCYYHRSVYLSFSLFLFLSVFCF